MNLPPSLAAELALAEAAALEAELGKSGPELITLALPPLYPKQLQIKDEGLRFNVLDIGRRAGKTFLGIHLALETAAQGFPVGWFAPSYKYVLEVWRDLLRPVAGIATKINATERRIELPNGGLIEVWTLENADAGRGRKYKRAIVDEAAMVAKLKTSWEESIRPTLTDYQGDAWFLSCVVANTRIFSAQGCVTIASVDSERTPGKFVPYRVPVAGFAGAMQMATDFYVSGLAPTIKVTSSAGYHLEGTHNHPIWAMGEDGNARWMRLDEIREGTYVAIRRGMNVWGNDDDLTGFAPGRRKRPSHRMDGNCDLSIMTPDLAYLMGLILGDGSVYYPIGKVTISHSVEESDTIDFLERGPVGLKFRRSERRPDHSVASNYRFTDFLQWYGFKVGAKAKDKLIPERLFRASKETVRHFLSGLFDADGTARARKGLVSFSSTSAEMVDQVRTLLLNFGIICRRSVGTSHAARYPSGRVKVDSTLYTITLSPYDSAIFYEQIGFRLSRKQERRSLLPDYDSPRSRRWDGVPLQGERIGRIRKGAWFKGNVTRGFGCIEKQEIVGYGKLPEVLERCAHSTATEDLAALRRLQEENYFWDRIVEIQHGEAETFDLVVPETHAFVSNGLISHNTPKGLNYFYDLFQRGQDPEQFPSWRSWHLPSAVNPYLPPSEIDAARLELPEQVFKQEYLAEFLSGDGAVFRNVDACLLAPETLPEAHAGHYVVAGVDWARQHDFTAISIICCHCEQEVALDRFNQIGWEFQRSRLLALLLKWGVSYAVVETNSIGSPNLEALNNEAPEEIGLHGFETTAKSKPKLIQDLALAFEKATLQWLPDPTARHELIAYEATVTESGHVKYGAPEGGWDDTVIARALAYRGAKGNIPMDLTPEEAREAKLPAVLQLKNAPKFDTDNVADAWRWETPRKLALARLEKEEEEEIQRQDPLSVFDRCL